MNSKQKNDTSEDSQKLLKKGKEALNEGREAAAEAVGKAQDKAAAVLDDQKSSFAAQIADISEAAHNAADDLREREQGFAADLVEQVAGGMHRASEGLRSNDLKAIYGEVEDFARRQPAVFIAGTALLGFAVARFAKASGHRHASSSRDTPAESMASQKHRGG